MKTLKIISILHSFPHLIKSFINLHQGYKLCFQSHLSHARTFLGTKKKKTAQNQPLFKQEYCWVPGRKQLWKIKRYIKYFDWKKSQWKNPLGQPRHQCTYDMYENYKVLYKSSASYLFSQKIQL